MTKFKTVLLAATALTMVSGAAIANDGNKVFIDQAGTNNTLTTTQSGDHNSISVPTGEQRARQGSTGFTCHPPIW